MATSSAVTVQNISDKVEEHHLKELFEVCGPVKGIRSNRDTNGTRSCEVEFHQGAHAKAAVFLSGTTLGDKALSITLKTASAPHSTMSTALLIPQIPAPIAPPSASLAAATLGSQNLPTPLLLASQKRADEVARTVYVGNVNVAITEEGLKQFFAQCGKVLYVKLANEVGGTGARFAFLEFETQLAAQLALQLTGSTLLDRQIKVGKANNPIYKPAPTVGSKNIDDVMKKVNEASQRLQRRSQSRSRSRDRHHRKGSRSRSRSRGRRPRSRSRDKNPPRRRREVEERKGMFFNGFTWQAIEDPKPAGLLPF